MSMQIERRLIELEKRTAPDNLIKTVIWSILDPGHLDAEMVYATADSGETWTRQPGETEEQFLQRAENEVTRDARGFARLIADSKAEA